MKNLYIKNKMGCSSTKTNKISYKISFRCIYDVKDENEIQIINDRYEDLINEEIQSKIKILNDDKKEDLILKKKFNKLGYNTIDFIIEGQLNNMSLMFLDCRSLKKIEFVSTDASQVTYMYSMFDGCVELEYINFNNFNTSNVSDMGGMFYECHKLKEINGINNFDTSKVVNMGGMFYECHKLKEIKGINNFNTSKVVIMG